MKYSVGPIGVICPAEVTLTIAVLVAEQLFASGDERQSLLTARFPQQSVRLEHGGCCVVLADD